ncbi:Nucleic acid-binding, OB-fold [Pseudocohnilembus persalinus]|uniref:aspartate--tRNA ligase n=1 Tax=Pseudocohnilembus persalinus TaxID=266149 RepID=A0A0V0QZH2_PSEPJ|nr:Nucleic acid-binding, OB-fold [Pseudocohnilembus persalinus]|eukprot:KRX07450.1 Nucleic acid-binding, OB-fold [Pseudocohnilembus persalinus]
MSTQEQEIKKQEEQQEQQQQQQEQGGENKGPSKKELKKLEKQRQKEEAEKKRLEEERQKEQEEIKNDPFNKNYGDLPLIQSQSKTDRKWTEIKDINESLEGQTVLVRARLHNIRKGKFAFLVLRQNYSSIQAIVAANEDYISKTMVKFVGKVPCESIVDITGVITKADVKSEQITQNTVEIQIQTFFVASRSRPVLPFQLDDASRKVHGNEMDDEEQQEEQKGQEVNVTMKTRLDNRIIDLRTPAKQAIFKVQAGVCKLFREFLMKNEFMEIHTPKLIGGSSEGGSNVFSFQYFNQPACLAQSPQLYKQMCIMADFKRVFEIGPVFRAEKSFTHRHMCEFTGLDMEMEIKENWHEALDMMAGITCFKT